MKRVVDVVASVVAGALLMPVMGVVALLVLVTLGRPVLFRQRRSGLHGAEFTIVKFRTMRPPAFEGESDLGRDTRAGRLLRASSLDELPQLWNVLRGDMSLIGPRPTLPEQVRHYDDRQRGRLSVRPGITGWAQVHGRNAISWPERIELDLDYIARRSWRLDVVILALTLRRLVRPAGIQGEGGVNPGFPIPDTAPPASRSDPVAGRHPVDHVEDHARQPHEVVQLSRPPYRTPRLRRRGGPPDACGAAPTGPAATAVPDG